MIKSITGIVFFSHGFIQNLFFISVADPDPVGSRLFGSPGYGSGKIPDQDPDPLSTRKPCNSNILVV